jgi:hypothetical protein
MRRTLQKRQPSLASVRAATSVAWEELCLLRHERLAAIRLLSQARTRAPTGGTYVRPTDLVCRHAEGGALFFFDQRRRQLAFRQIRCASHKLAGNLLCLSRAAGRARELALPSQRNHLRGRDGRHLQLFAADGDARTYARTLAHAQAHPRSHAHTDARDTHTHTHACTNARSHPYNRMRVYARQVAPC